MNFRTISNTSSRKSRFWRWLIHPLLNYYRWKQKREKARIIYSLCIADIETVAAEQLSRPLTSEELLSVIEQLPRYIHWYDAIADAIYRTQHV